MPFFSSISTSSKSLRGFKQKCSLTTSTGASDTPSPLSSSPSSPLSLCFSCCPPALVLSALLRFCERALLMRRASSTVSLRRERSFEDAKPQAPLRRTRTPKPSSMPKDISLNVPSRRSITAVRFISTLMSAKSAPRATTHSNADFISSSISLHASYSLPRSPHPPTSSPPPLQTTIFLRISLLLIPAFSNVAAGSVCGRKYLYNIIVFIIARRCEPRVGPTRSQALDT